MLLGVRGDDFDETNAMLTFLQQVRSIRNRPIPNAFNLESEVVATKRGIASLSTRLGMPNAEAWGPNDIELDMHSPLELVELRDLLVKLGDLTDAQKKRGQTR